MNKAYVLVGSNECGEIENFAVFDNIEKAEKVCADLNEKGIGEWDMFRIETFVINKAPNSVANI